MPSHTPAERKKRLAEQFGTSKRQTRAQAKNTRIASGRKRGGTTLAKTLQSKETESQRKARQRRQTAAAKRRRP